MPARSINRLIRILQLPRNIHNADEPFDCQGIRLDGGKCRIRIGEETRRHISLAILPDLAMRLQQRQFDLLEDGLDELSTYVLCARHHRDVADQRARLCENWATLILEQFDENEHEVAEGIPNNDHERDAIGAGPHNDEHEDGDTNEAPPDRDQDVVERAVSGQSSASPRRIIEIYSLPPSEESAQSFRSEVMDELANRHNNIVGANSPRHTSASRDEQSDHDIESRRDRRHRVDLDEGSSHGSSFERRRGTPQSYRSSVHHGENDAQQSQQHSSASRSTHSGLSRLSNHSRQDPLNESRQSPNTTRSEQADTRVDRNTRSNRQSYVPQSPGRGGSVYRADRIVMGRGDDRGRQNAYEDEDDEDDELPQERCDLHAYNRPARCECYYRREREIAADQVYTESMTDVIGAMHRLLGARDVRDSIRNGLEDCRPTYSQPYGGQIIHYDDLDQMTSRDGTARPQRTKETPNLGNDEVRYPLQPHQHPHERINRGPPQHISTPSCAFSKSRNDHRAGPSIQDGRIPPRRITTMREI